MACSLFVLDTEIAGISVTSTSRLRFESRKGVFMSENQNKKRPEHVTAQSPDLRADLYARLRDLVPEAFAEGKLDAGKLKALLGENGDAGAERYSFSWAGKRDAMSMLQVPTRATLIPDRDNSVNFDEAQHVFIEGENLEVLKVLYRSYFGRVKMIYIDPPYNTGNDFIYPDDFADPLDHYLRITGQKNGNGDYTTSQVDRNGRIHSAWLSMMYPRLALARQFLSDDGVVCVSISDHELPNLRLLLDQIFGEESFVAQFIWKSRKFPDSRSTMQVSVDHEYIVAYRRSAEAQFRGVERDETKYANPDNDSRGAWMSRSMLGLATAEQRPNLHFKITDPNTKVDYWPPAETGWRYNPARMEKLIKAGCVLFPAKADGRPREKKFMADLENEFMAIPTIIDDVYTSDGTEEIRKIFGFQAFDFPKPSELLRRFVEQLSGDGDVILDFFAGSCPTAHAVMEQNHRDGRQRRYVCVQLPEKLPAESESAKRGFPNIAEVGKFRIKETAKGYLENNGNGGTASVRMFRLSLSSFRNWTGVADKDADKLASQIEAFSESFVPGWKPENVIWETALREGYSLTTRIEKIPDTGKQNFWRVTDPEREQSFVICLDDTLTLDAVRALKLGKDALFVCRDAALDDTLSANLALQCRLKVL